MAQGKEVQPLANTTGTGAQTAVRFNITLELAGTLVVDISATGSVELQGRISPDAPWVVLATVNTAGATSTNIARMFPEMRANVTANTGTIRVWVLG